MRWMPSDILLWPLLIIVSALTVSLVAATGFGGTLRGPLFFYFLLICPGMAFIRLLHIASVAAEWTLAIALSLALDTIIAEIMLYANHWSPIGGLVILILVSVLGAGCQLLVWSTTRRNDHRSGQERNLS